MSRSWISVEECEERLNAGWFVFLDDCCDHDSAQRKRYIRLERERLIQIQRSLPSESVQDLATKNWHT